jgi:hypothetical protein
MADDTLGKLIRTLSERCPECKEHKLQLRSIVKATSQKGIQLSETITVKQCPLCLYQAESGEKKRKEKVALRDSFTAVKEVSKNDRYPKRDTASRSPRNGTSRGVRTNGR